MNRDRFRVCPWLVVAILALVPAERRQTLIAKRGTIPGEWTFEIHLQGAQETVFFDV